MVCTTSVIKGSASLRRRAIVVLVTAIGLALQTSSSAGDRGSGLSKPSGASKFGWSVAVHADVIVVGAPGIGNGTAAGRAFVYSRSGAAFDRVAELVPSDSFAKDGFGDAVAIDGNTIVVGSANAYGIASKAYVFTEPAGGWAGIVNETVRLVPAAYNGAGSRFGSAVAVSLTPQRTVAVGDEKETFVFVEPPAGWSGVAYETARLVSSTADGLHEHGSSIAMNADVIVTGDPDQSRRYDVSVYVRPAGGWTGVQIENARLSDVDGTARGFGAVGLSGEHIVVGASLAWVGESRYQGVAYLFRQPATGWSGTLTPQATLIASDATWYDEFGYSVAFDGDVVMVGTNSGATDGSQNDGVYRFEMPSGGWSGTLVETSQLPTFSSNVFGSAVATHAGTTVVGDQLHGAPSNFTGAAFAYLLDTDNDVVPDVIDNCPATPNQFQTDTDLDGDGDACDLDDDNDLTPDTSDNCPVDVNPDQSDLDGDDQGDVCDPDDDNDLVPDTTDNCPVTANADQADLDADGLGDACDSDADGDLVEDVADNCPMVANPAQYDLDDDGVGDGCDAENPVVVDVLPGQSPNAVRSAGRFVPVAVYSRLSFAPVDRIDVDSLRFGKTGAEAPATNCVAIDFNGDAIADLVCEFEVSATKLKPTDRTGVLTGVTRGPETTRFVGNDAVVLKGPPR